MSTVVLYKNKIPMSLIVPPTIGPMAHYRVIKTKNEKKIRAKLKIKLLKIKIIQKRVKIALKGCLACVVFSSAGKTFRAD